VHRPGQGTKLFAVELAVFIGIEHREEDFRANRRTAASFWAAVWTFAHSAALTRPSASFGATALGTTLTIARTSFAEALAHRFTHFLPLLVAQLAIFVGIKFFQSSLSPLGIPGAAFGRIGRILGQYRKRH
jgi:hypothetical protein